MQHKRCTKCGDTKPAEDFPPKRPECRACRRAYNQAYRAANLTQIKAQRKAEYQRNRQTILDAKRKPCSRCGGVKPPGAKRYCQTCKPLADADYREKDRQSTRAWVAANRDRKLAYDRAWREANKEHAEAVIKAWREANPERVKANSERNRKRWRAENPDRARELWQRYFTRKRDAFVEDVHPLVVLERADGVCGICDLDVDPFDFHVDHIMPLARGGEHSYANTQPAHPVCNSRKGAKAP